MGLFGLFKKRGNYFDKSIAPKCAYCEHGKPAKSEGKILCSKCGIVSSNFSCKKFSYSPFLRIPEKEHPDPDEALISKNAIHDSKITESVTDKNVDKKTITDEYNKANFFPDQLQYSKETEDISEIKAENNTDCIKKEIPPKNEISLISDIKLTPNDNAENIKKLEAVPHAEISIIDNHPVKKEIVLPDIQECSVSSLSNTSVTQNNREYLKSVRLQPVSSIEYKNQTLHSLPAETKTAELSELNK